MSGDKDRKKSMEIANVSWQTLAGYHSNLTGVLAGFTFAALTLLLTNPPKNVNNNSSKISVYIYALLVVFFGLILTSFLLAATTGDKEDQRAAYRAIVASLAFAISTPLMFVSLSWFFKVYGIDNDVLRYTRTLTRVICAASGFYIIRTFAHEIPYAGMVGCLSSDTR